MTLIDLIRQYRDDHDLSQRQFAEQCGLSNGYISMLENGMNPKTRQPITPTMQALQKLASGMRMSLTEMLSSVDDMPVYLGEIKPPATANGDGMSETKSKLWNAVQGMTEEQAEAWLRVLFPEAAERNDQDDA